MATNIKQQQQKHQKSFKATPPCLLAFALLFVLVVTFQTAFAKSLLDDGNETSLDSFSNNHEQQNSWHHYQSNHHHQPHHRRRLQRRNSEGYAAGHNSASNSNNSPIEQCESVRGYFDSIDIKLNGIYEEKGPICNGNCCSNATETLLSKMAKNDFERLLDDHTRSLREVLESTAKRFQDHILELAEQSENNTLNVFSQVYRRMVPLSRKLIHELYGVIMSQLRISDKSKGSNNVIQDLNSLEEALQKFFVNLFPVAYHQAVHLSKENYGELHQDYINCLKHTFDELQPFGAIPKDTKRNLLQSIQIAKTFMNTLIQSAEVLGETNDLYATYLTPTCQKHLLKMSYCPSCNGMQEKQVKTCFSYCMNVLRGCSAQYAAVLDSPWSSVVDAINNLVRTHIHTDDSILTTIKQLDAKLSEAIMQAMEHGPELEQKVKKTCGTPKLLRSQATEEIIPMTQHSKKWATPPEAEILPLLSIIDQSKEFYSNIVNNVCEDKNMQHNNHNCWTGDRVGDYTNIVMTISVDTQRYNPEVPLETNSQSAKLNELMDKLIKIRKNVGTAVPAATRVHSDIQSDMARHDEEGSGGHILDENDDDDEYDVMQGSGDGSDGSGDDNAAQSNIPDRPITPIDNEVESRESSTGSSSQLATTSSLIVCLIGTFSSILVTLLLRGDS